MTARGHGHNRHVVTFGDLVCSAEVQDVIRWIRIHLRDAQGDLIILLVDIRFYRRCLW